MASRSEIEARVKELSSIQALQRTGNEKHLLDYYRTRLSVPSQPEQRTVLQQVELHGKCPFGSEEFIEELLNLCAAQPDESDPNGNRVAQLKGIGRSLAFVATDQDTVTKVLERVHDFANTTSDKQALLSGLSEHPSFSGAILLEESLKTEWQL